MTVRYEELPEFPNYVAGDNGEILNMKSGGYAIKPSINHQGLPKITLIQDGRPKTRSPAKLVAEVFVPQEREDFNTVIHLNNDRTDCRACNLMWRPRWFAIAYHKQFYRDTFHQHQYPIEDVSTGERYESPKAACMAHGILFNDIILTFTNPSYCFPTYQQFSHVT